MNDKERLELKLKDYQLFIATLLIVGSYLYMGAIINTYIRPSGDGEALFTLSLILVVSGIGLFDHRQRLKAKHEQNEH